MPLSEEEAVALVMAPTTSEGDLALAKKRLWAMDQAMIEMIDRVKLLETLLELHKKNFAAQADAVEEMHRLTSHHTTVLDDHDARINWLET